MTTATEPRKIWGLAESLPSLDPRIVVIVPRRKDNGPRDALWEVCRERWEKVFGFPIYEGHHDDGPFNRSMALNLAARAADAESEDGDWEIAIVIDSDILISHDAVQDAIAIAIDTGKVVWPHRSWNGLTERATADLLGQPDVYLSPELPRTTLEASVEKTNPISWSCCIVVPRGAWDFLGGFDERFRGWGFEDMAFQSAVVGLVGYERLDAPLFHLWHPRKPGLGTGTRDKAGMHTIESVTNARLGRRYMVALRRDHKLHDRVAESDEAELARDIQNLRNDDQRLALEAKRLGMPDWSGWWPTLMELVDQDPPPDASVALVVHSGGTEETWPDRWPLLETTLEQASVLLASRAWERKVIYSDWPASVRSKLDDLATQFGFYVVGTPGHVGYTPSMQAMWRYINRRVTAEYVFQTEDDFELHGPVIVDDMVSVLATRPYLVQLALLREPFYDAERDPATILGHPRAAFELHDEATNVWLEHTRFFTVNPMLMRTSLTRKPWPAGQHSEAVYGRALFSDTSVRAGLWGDGTPMISHQGTVRAGSGY